MKRYNYITGARTRGTTFYKTTINQIISVLESHNMNIFDIEALKTYKFDALDIDAMYGSQIIDDNLYICDTDGELITVKDEKIDPEDAFIYYAPDELSKYIDNASDDIILKYITDYEINLIDIDRLAKNLLNDGHSFLDLYVAASELQLAI